MQIVFRLSSSSLTTLSSRAMLQKKFAMERSHYTFTLTELPFILTVITHTYRHATFSVRVTETTLAVEIHQIMVSNKFEYLNRKLCLWCDSIFCHWNCWILSIRAAENSMQIASGVFKNQLFCVHNSSYWPCESDTFDIFTLKSYILLSLNSAHACADQTLQEC